MPIALPYMKLFWSVVLLIFLSLPSFSVASDFSGRVVAILDGDTIEVLHNGKAERIRLAGIDCPEKRQPFGQKAKQFTSTLVFGKHVTVQPVAKDRHKRTVGEVILPDGRNLSRELLRAGLAWWYRAYSTNLLLAMLELEAQEAQRGLWSDPNPTPPWELRRHSKKRPALTSTIPSQRHLDQVQESGTIVVGLRAVEAEARA